MVLVLTWCVVRLLKNRRFQIPLYHYGHFMAKFLGQNCGETCAKNYAKVNL